MKKIFSVFLMVLVALSLGLSNLKADETRTINHVTKVVTSNTVVETHGVTVYKVSGYANAANAIYALCNQASLATPDSTAYKVEGGEASQYDSIPTLDFGDEGIRFSTGLTVFTVGSYLVIEYE